MVFIRSYWSQWLLPSFLDPRWSLERRLRRLFLAIPRKMLDWPRSSNMCHDDEEATWVLVCFRVIFKIQPWRIFKIPPIKVDGRIVLPRGLATFCGFPGELGYYSILTYTVSNNGSLKSCFCFSRILEYACLNLSRFTFHHFTISHQCMLFASTL